jgi:hypothetical protein
MRLLLLPRSTLPASFSEAAAQFIADVSATGSLELSTPVRGVVLSLMLAAGAVSTADTLEHRSLYRPLLVPVILTALLAYRDGVSSPLIPVAALSIAAFALFLDGDHIRSAQTRNRVRELPSAVVVGFLILYISHTVGAAAVHQLFAEPVRREVASRLEQQESRTITRVEFSNMDDAKKWVEQHMNAAQPEPGNVSDVLASGSGSASQLEAVAASLASAGGVDVEIRSDGSRTFSLPKPGVTPDVVVVQKETGSSPAAPGAQVPGVTSPGVTSPGAASPGEAVSSSSTDTAVAGGGGSSTVTSSPERSVTGAPSERPATTNSVPVSTSTPSTPTTTTAPSQAGDTSRTSILSIGVLLLVLLVLGGAVIGLVRRRKASQRLTANASGRARVLAAWHSADAALSRRTGTSREADETFRERTEMISGIDAPTDEAFRSLSELADQAAFSQVEPDPTHAERLASDILSGSNRHR